MHTSKPFFLLVLTLLAPQTSFIHALSYRILSTCQVAYVVYTLATHKRHLAPDSVTKCHIYSHFVERLTHTHRTSVTHVTHVINTGRRLAAS